jgi:putative DNA primase/helicase
MDLQEHEKHPHNGVLSMTIPANSEMITGQQKTDFNLTDLGNSNRLIEQYGDRIKFCSTYRQWMVWNGKYWEKDTKATVAMLIREVIKSLYQEAQQTEDEVTRTKIAKHAMGSENVNRIRAIAALAKDDQRIRVSAEELDTDIFQLNCTNGTINLRTGQMKRHDPDDLITKIVPVDYDPNSTCPNFDKFLFQIMAGEIEMVKYLQRLLGYTLTGDTREQCFHIFYGNGSNGKSTLLNLWGKLLSDYAKQSQPETFLDINKGKINNDIARLQGSRLVSTTEPDANQCFAEGVIKQMTGGDPITARFLRKEFSEFTPQFKLFMATNYKPNIKGKDFGIWRRVRLIPFAVIIPPHEQDQQLDEKLNTELPGILAWAVQGCLDWLKNGLGLPKVISEGTDSYRKEMDIVGRFIDDCCTVGAFQSVSCQLLFNQYSNWCRLEGEPLKSKVALGKELKLRNFEPDRTSTDRYWKGIGLKTIPQIPGNLSTPTISATHTFI